ncbi:MAG: osmoprotectant transport system substrate-binding protein opuBD [Solirubrobacteraceae bacterium]|jgi:osmoprotectant transport system permease protein|nr:osmoprotectant transport system substrate-binding protein opuBD [Solirubrobacteraceae bacterium]
MMLAFLGDFGDGVRFIFDARESSAGTVEVGGLGEIGHLAGNHVLVSMLAVGISVVIALPIALILGHLGKGEFLAISVSNVGRAVPSLAIIAFFVAFLGTGFTNVCFALILLAIPPILTNTYVAVRQVDPEIVDAARGQGFSEAQIIRKVELPLALPTIFGGIRLSSVNVLATAIIAPLAGYETLGTPILSLNVYGFAGAIGAAIVVALLTLTADAGFAAVQRLTTPKGLKIGKGNRRLRFLPTSRRSMQTP